MELARRPSVRRLRLAGFSALLLVGAVSGAMARAGPNTALNLRPAVPFATAVRVVPGNRECPPAFALELVRRTKATDSYVVGAIQRDHRSRRIVVPVTHSRVERGGALGSVLVPLGSLTKGVWSVEIRLRERNVGRPTPFRPVQSLLLDAR